MRLLLIGNEPVLPITNGGRARMFGIAHSLAASMDVHTVEPLERARDRTIRVPVEPGITRHFVGRRTGRGIRYLANPGPRLGFTCLGRDAVREVQTVIQDLAPDVVAVSHSYLAPRVRSLVPKGATFLVDFANVEYQRLRSLSDLGRLHNRVSASWESMKATSWEPRVARDADVCVAVDVCDQETLVSWGAKCTCIVPNSVDALPMYSPSPAQGPAVFLGSGNYAPNVAGGRWLLDAVWPQVRNLSPGAELWIVGRGTESTFRDIPTLGVRVLGGVEDLSEVLNSCAICVVPVGSGAGTQLKTLDILARHRTVVTTRFSSRSIPGRASENCFIEDSSTGFAHAVVNALTDVEGRRAREVMVAGHVPVWSESVRALSELLHSSASLEGQVKVPR